MIERRWASGHTYALRFLAYGRRYYVRLGSQREGSTRAKAQEELQNVRADVRRGIWIPPACAPQKEPEPALGAPPAEPSFHEFASAWLAGRRGELRARAVEFYECALSRC